MYKTKEFDYDLWTTTDGGIRHCWVRVKATGEVSEVSPEVMKFLRAEEKRVYREIKAAQKRGSSLSLDDSHDEGKESWFSDHGFGTSEMEKALVEEAFCQLLTPIQLSVFRECLLGQIPLSEYARKNGITKQSVSDVIEGIRKKAKKFFDHT